MRQSLEEKFELRSHMDIVRGTQFVASADALASISEDCMVKLWNLTELEKKFTEPDSVLEPYMTLRGHTGPLLCIESISGSRKAQTNSSLLFTAGIEGTIRVWNVPKVSEVNSYGDTHDGKNYCVEVWQDESQEAIWGMKYHPFGDLLLSINATGAIVIWDCSQVDTEASNSHTGTVKKRI